MRYSLGFIWSYREVDEKDESWAEIGAPYDVSNRFDRNREREPDETDEKYNVPKGLGGFRF